MNYQEQRMTFWRETFLDSGKNYTDIAAIYADQALAEFDKRFADKIEPLPELTNDPSEAV